MISEVTRRDLRDLLERERTWSGRLTDGEFLGRLYNLGALPSTDRRYSNMADDVGKHTPPVNDDWGDGWVFTDSRLGFEDDKTYLRFLAETVHPAVAAPDLDVETRVKAINEVLTPDGYELVPERSLSGRPVYGARMITPRRAPSGQFSSSLISGTAKVFSEAFSHTDIDSLFEDQDFPRPKDFGGNKVEKVKAWLRTADRDPGFKHWDGLAKVMQAVLEPDAADGTPLQAWQKTIRGLLATAGVTYLPGGMLTTGAGTSALTVGGVPDLFLPPPGDWLRLGQGGFGTVYALRDERLGVDFALKIFDPSPFTDAVDASARFLREAGLLFRLNHKYIVRIFHAGTLHDGRPFIRMERFNGDTLQAFLDRRAATVDEGVGIVGRLAAALEHAHGQSIYHRDLKPSNVLVNASLDDLRLIDFGLGILVEEAVARSRLTTSDHHFGGAYSAPELLENAKTVGPELDVYSLGAIWYRLTIGRAPQGTGIDGLIDGSALPPELRTILRRCLSGPATRPSMTELVNLLRAWVKARSGAR